MQPTLVITSPVPGMIHINGRFAGEASADAPLFTPVAAFGPVYLECRPLQPGWLPMARRLVLSGGAPMAESLEQSDDVFAIRWPGGVIEIELMPARDASEHSEPLALGGLNARLIRGRECRLELDGLSCPLPLDAHAPEATRFGDAIALLGQAGDGQYLLTLSENPLRQTGFLRAGRIDFEAAQTVRALTDRRDVAGHGVLERWQLNSSGLALISSDPVWMDGAPRPPASPEQAALAALEAALLGFADEAAEYFVPSASEFFPPDRISELGEIALPMKFGTPGGAPAVGLLHVESANTALVRPVFFRAVQSGGQWRLTQLLPEP